jgi:hypothetical protein
MSNKLINWRMGRRMEGMDKSRAETDARNAPDLRDAARPRPAH